MGKLPTSLVLRAEDTPVILLPIQPLIVVFLSPTKCGRILASVLQSTLCALDTAPQFSLIPSEEIDVFPQLGIKICPDLRLVANIQLTTTTKKNKTPANH